MSSKDKSTDGGRGMIEKARTDLEKMYAYVEKLVQGALDDWWKVQIRDPYAMMYLYHKKGGLTIAAKNPGKPWELSMPERISPAWSREQAYNVIRFKAKSLPIIPPEIPEE